jgi:hypothetical protein
MSAFQDSNIKLMPDHEPLSASRDTFVRCLNTFRIVLRNEDMMYVITSPLPSQPSPHYMRRKPFKAFNDEEGVKRYCWLAWIRS